MNRHSRDIKRNQESILKRITVDPPRYTHEQTYKHRTGKTKRFTPFLDIMRFGTYNPYGEAKGEDTKNLGPWIEDPRMGNKTAPTNSYVRKKAIQRRGQYRGPYSSTGTHNDYRAISSIPINRYKGRRGRKMLFRRGEKIYDTKLNPSQKLLAKQSKLPEAKDDSIKPLNVMLERVPDYLERTDFNRNEVVQNQLPLINPAKPVTIREGMTANREFLVTEKPRSKIHSVVNTQLERLIISNRELLGTDMLKNNTTVNGATATKQEIKQLSNIVFLHKAAEQMSKTGKIKSGQLTQAQKSIVSKFLKSESERDLINTVSKFKNEIINGIKSGDFKIETLETLVNDVSKKYQLKTGHLRDLVFAPLKDTKVNVLMKIPIKNFRIMREITASGKDLLYDDRMESRPRNEIRNTLISQSQFSRPEVQDSKLGKLGNTVDMVGKLDSFVATINNDPRRSMRVHAVNNQTGILPRGLRTKTKNLGSTKALNR
jgi:hypothetical protein